MGVTPDEMIATPDARINTIPAPPENTRPAQQDTMTSMQVRAGPQNDQVKMTAQQMQAEREAMDRDAPDYP